MDKTCLTFFHNSDRNWQEVPALFQPRLRKENLEEDHRPAFYWFNEHWHSNFPAIRENYFYLFCKNPKDDKIEFRARHEGGDFNGLFTYYTTYLQGKTGKDMGSLYMTWQSGKFYCEPSILMSFSPIEPDLVLHFKNPQDRYGTVVKPESHKGKEIYLFDANFWPIRFTEIPEIVEIVPQIINSLPFVTPKVIKNEFIYEDWVPMLTAKSGTWL